MIWEKIYFCFFAYKIAGFCILYHAKKRYDLGVMTVSFLLSFLITRIVAIQFPTQGPAFYRPELFAMPGSWTEEGRRWLLLYMEGVGTQNGLTPGTMAMPSLHVGLTVTVAWFLFSNFRWTGWISAPWIILTWLSTIFLGWHYILDGLGGILVCVSSIIISDSAAKLFNSLKLLFKRMLNK